MIVSRSTLLRSFAMLCIVSIGLAAVGFSVSQTSHTGRAQAASDQLNLADFQAGFGQQPATLFSPSNDSYQVVRAYFTNRQMVYELAQWLEPWEVHYNQGYLVVAVTPDEFALMQALGFRLEVDQALTDQMNQPRIASPQQTNGIAGYPCYRTVEETYASAQALATTHPNLASWIDIGDSWRKSTTGSQGYDLMVLRLTNSAVQGIKPKLFAMSSVHAREYAPAELATRFAEYLVQNYGVNPDVTWLLDYNEIHLLLQANPDGRKYAEGGQLWRKNINQNYCSPVSPNRGADINRNFSFKWGCCGGSSGSGCNETYRGPSPASEPETQAVQNYVRYIFSDQRGPELTDTAPITTTGVFIDLHSYSQLVLWPWGFTSNKAPNNTALQTLGRKFAYYNDYSPEQAIELYPTDGTTDDFVYGETGVASYTIEMGYAFFEPCTNFEEIILPENLPALLYAAKVARAPYLLPSGPDALALTVSPTRIVAGTSAQLSATIDDTRYNQTNRIEPTQNILAAEYYIDIPPWITTTTPVPYPMFAVDSSFDEPVETVSAGLNTAGLSNGRHILFIRGQDADGNWGPVTALFFELWGPNFVYSPLIQK